MKRLIASPFVLALVVAAVLFGFARRILNRPRPIGSSVIKDPEETTLTDPETGAVRSVQGADIDLPADRLEELWSPTNLERLARTYWRFLTRVTLGTVRIYYEHDGRQVCLLIPQLPLLTFQAPEYQMDADRGIVRWRIEKGLLVSGRGRGGNGYLEIDVQRCPRDAGDDPARGRLHAEVEIANFYPSLASGIGQWFYVNTQSRIHVIVCHAFLRSLARLDLAESKVGRFSQQTPPAPSLDQVPDPPPGGQRQGLDRPMVAR